MLQKEPTAKNGLKLKQEHIDSPVGIIEAVIDAAFVLDIVLNFRTAYYNQAGCLIFDRQKVVQHYTKGWLAIDVLAAVPFHHGVQDIEHNLAMIILRTVKYAVLTASLRPLACMRVLWLQ